MENLVKSVEHMKISMDIIDGADDSVKNRCVALRKRVEAGLLKVQEAKRLMEQYEENIRKMQLQEKQFEDLKLKLLYIQKYFPRGIIGINNEPEEVPPAPVEEIEKPAEQKNIKRPAKNVAPIPSRVTGENISLSPNVNNMTLSVPKIIFPGNNGSNTISTSSTIPEEVPKASSDPEAPINHVTTMELSNLPSYMRGRLTLSEINEFVDIVNSTLKKKMQLMKKSKRSKSKAELDQCLIWKEQEKGELLGNTFCTAEDFDKLSSVKLGNKKYLNILTILRHLKRLKEIRNNKVIYYVA